MSKDQRRFITVKVVNGKTGKSVWNVIAHVSVGKAIEDDLKSGKVSNRYRTNLFGDTRVEVTAANPSKLRVWVDFISDGCGDPTEEYSIDEI